MRADKFNQLINRIKEYDKEAFNEIYDEYSKLVTWIALKFAKNKEDAQDIFNIVFAGIWNKARAYKYVEQPDDWISKITKNESINYYNKFIKKQSKDLEYDMVSDEDFFRFLSAGNSFSEIEFDSMIAHLTDSERQIVKLKIYYEYTHEEIAKKLNMPLGTVTWKYSNSIKKLRSQHDKKKVN